MEKIDFVIPWVDGGDPDWQKEFSAYRRESGLSDASTARYRDWDNLRYWFRAIEEFTPWVNNVHFITWGHVPQWLNTKNPKLHIVNHKDYIPAEYLPTFSSHAIELNMHRIEGLSERFVYFNDDMFFGREASQDRFFRSGLPCDIARLGIIQPSSVDHIVLNDVNVINRRFNKKSVIKQNRGKWLNCKYGMSDIMKTLSLMPWATFPGFKDTHMPQPYLKSTFERLWNEEREILDNTCRNRFRTLTDVNQWLMRYEQLARGEFSPVSDKDVKQDLLGNNEIDSIAAFIKEKKYVMFCLNDSNDITDFEKIKNRLNSAFETTLNKKCGYEL